MSFYGQRLRQFRTGTFYGWWRPNIRLHPVDPTVVRSKVPATPLEFATELKGYAEEGLEQDLPSVEDLAAEVVAVEAGGLPSPLLVKALAAGYGVSEERQALWLGEDAARLAGARKPRAGARPSRGTRQLPLYLLDEFCAGNTYAAIAAGDPAFRDGTLTLPASMAPQATLAITVTPHAGLLDADTLVLARPAVAGPIPQGGLALAAVSQGLDAYYVLRRLRRLRDGQLVLCTEDTSAFQCLLPVAGDGLVCLAAHVLLTLPEARTHGCVWGGGGAAAPTPDSQAA
ncbi:MAG: hypothetical protein VKS61_02120 [Candidatus Sericytochromatia bacterium]|nr:hypothetical protein [Candidatus Sericytochromatia bacterium]